MAETVRPNAPEILINELQRIAEKRAREVDERSARERTPYLAKRINDFIEGNISSDYVVGDSADRLPLTIDGTKDMRLICNVPVENNGEQEQIEVSVTRHLEGPGRPEFSIGFANGEELYYIQDNMGTIESKRHKCMDGLRMPEMPVRDSRFGGPISRVNFDTGTVDQLHSLLDILHGPDVAISVDLKPKVNPEIDYMQR